MSSIEGIEGIEQIGDAVAGIEIQGPDAASREQREIEAAVADARKDLPSREPETVVGVDGSVLKMTSTEFPEGTTFAAAVQQAAEEEGLFDDSAYVAVPEVDGQNADQIVIAFGGQIAYDATDEQGAKLYQDLKLGKAVELRVAGFVSGKAGGYKVTARDEEVVTGKASVRIDTLYMLTPESLA
jgi:hypothetical protein